MSRSLVVNTKVSFRYQAHHGDICGELYLYSVPTEEKPLKLEVFNILVKEVPELDIAYLKIDNATKLKKTKKINPSTGNLLENE